ncbi:Dynamin like protein [Balamuthia mandrillaris]
MFKGRKEKESKKKAKEEDKARTSTEAEVEKRKSLSTEKRSTANEPEQKKTEEDESRKGDDDAVKREEEERRKRKDEDKKKEDVKQRRDDDRKKKKEQAEKKKLDEERRRMEEAEDEESEIQSLESVPMDSSVDYKEIYKLFPFGNFPEVFTSYDKLQGYARELNIQIVTPEIVLLGYQGQGKSSLIEGFLGQSVSHLGYDILSNFATKRPVYLRIINNPKFDKPKVTIKRDSLLKGQDYDHDVTVSVSDLSGELEKRNKISKYSEDPIYVQYEYKYCCNMTLIDTPGLIKDEEDSQCGDVQAIVYNTVKYPHRLILCVEEAKDWDKLDMFEFIKQVDPEFSRTTFVYTKFYFHLQRFTSTRQVNRYLGGSLPDAKCFFTTSLSPKVRAKFKDPAKFQEKIYQAVRRDLRSLEQLQYDRRYESSVGILQLRQYLLNLTWKKYQDAIPQILKRLRANKVDTQLRLAQVQAQLQGLNSVKLRSIASNYVIDFLQAVDKLLAGTSEGNPAVNGQTLEEEKAQSGDGDWLDSNKKTIRLDPEEWNIPYWDSKLYGGQQFERLLAEFKAVADHQKLPDISMDDIATAAGINKLNNIPNYAWAASDLAQQKAREELVPLIEQTCRRAVYVLLRLTDIVEKIVDSRRNAKWQTGSHDPTSVDVNDIDMYPFFTYHVKDLYNKFVELCSKRMLTKCLDEFYGTRTIYWEYTEYADRNLPMDRTDAEETKKAVEQLTKELFTRLRDRITKNILLKFYNFLLVPMQTELWNEIQGKVSTLGDDQLEQIFEVSATKSKLEEEEKALKKQIDAYSSQETAFIDAATHFSHPIYAQGAGSSSGSEKHK